MILGLDTATEFLHLALVGEEGAWTRRLEGGPGRSASLTLLPAIDGLLAEAGRERRDLRGVCACAGPGGFTSLRIGVATAEGLALSGLPTWGFSAFALREAALRARGVEGPVWILLDGQRGEAFFQKWEGEARSEAAKAPFAALDRWVGRNAWWAPASVAPRLQPHLASEPLDLAEEGASTLEGLVRLCRTLPATPPEVPIHPFYLRETDAELNFPHLSAHLSEAHRRGLAR